MLTLFKESDQLVGRRLQVHPGKQAPSSVLQGTDRCLSLKKYELKEI